MKKTIFAMLLAGMASGAFAGSGDACAGGAAANATVAEADSDFAVTAINFRCSQNVFLSWEDTSTVMAVGAGSAKGKNAFKGNSSGGAITVHAACAATGCLDTDAQGAATQGLTDASGSGT